MGIIIELMNFIQVFLNVHFSFLDVHGSIHSRRSVWERRMRSHLEGYVGKERPWLQSYATVVFCFFSSPLPIRALVLDSRYRGLSGPSWWASPGRKSPVNSFPFFDEEKRFRKLRLFSVHHPYVVHTLSVQRLRTFDRYEWPARLIVSFVLLFIA